MRALEFAWMAALALNLGLVFRVIAEPVERTGQGTGPTLALLAASALLQVGATLTFAGQLWPRVGPRPMRKKDEATA